MSATHSSGRSPRGGFTIAELLVVVTIIGILVALLIPAISSARESARQGDCAERLRQLSLHLDVFEGTHNRYPGWAEYPVAVRDFSNGDAALQVTTGWIPSILEQLNRRDLLGNIQDAPGTWRRPATLPLSVAAIGNGLANIPAQLVCPSDAEKTNFDFRLSNTQPVTSFIINCGRPDGQAAGLPPDWPANGVFLDMTATSQGLAQSKAKITKNDGLNTTLMLSESIAAISWSQLPLPVEAETGFLFLAPADLPNPYDGNRPLGLPSHPSSYHPKGVNAVFAGGNFSFINEKISYLVYAQLMTSHGANAREPGTTNPSDPLITSSMNLLKEMWQED